MCPLVVPEVDRAGGVVSSNKVSRETLSLRLNGKSPRGGLEYVRALDVGTQHKFQYAVSFTMLLLCL